MVLPGVLSSRMLGTVNSPPNSGSGGQWAPTSLALCASLLETKCDYEVTTITLYE